jgi:hypothetical protein
MTEGGNESHKLPSRVQSNSFEEITFAEPFVDTNVRESDTPEETTLHSNGVEKASGSDYRSATYQNHGIGVISSNASTVETVDESDRASVASTIPTSDSRPEIATFRRRQAQMLPICIPPTLLRKQC